MSESFTPSPAERFAAILRSLGEALAAQGVRGTLTGWLLILTVGRLNRAAQRVTAIAARLAAGTLRLPTRRRPQLSRTTPRPPPAATVPPKLSLPQRFGWLLRRLQPVETARCAVANHHAQLEHLLHQPDMLALIAGAPQVGRHIRPVCRMLGLRPPPALQRPRQPPAQAANPAEPPPLTRPAPPQPRPPQPRPPKSRPPKSRLRTMDDYGPPSRPGWERPVRLYAVLPTPGKAPKPA